MGAGASNNSNSIQQNRVALGAKDVTPPRCRSGTDLLTPTPPTTTRNPCLDRQTPGFWIFEEFPGEWKEFDPDSSKRIEHMYVQESAEATVVIKGRLHTIMFDSMKDNVSGGTGRSVRRRCCPTMDGDDLGSKRGSTIGGVAHVTSLQSHHRQSVSVVGDPFATTESNIEAITRSLDIVADDPDALRPVLHSTITAHAAAVFGTTFNLAGDKIMTGSKDGTCKLWELNTGFVVREFEQHPGAILSCAINKMNQSVVATGCDDWEARIFSTGESPAKHVLAGHHHKVYTVAFTSDGKHLLSSSMDGCMRQWDAHTGQCVKEIHAHSSSIFNLQVGPLSPWLAITASDDTLLAGHDLRLAKSVTHRYVGHEKTLWGCDIRFDEDQFLSCGMDARVIAWDPRNPTGPYNTITSHRNPVHCVEYMPDGVTFLSSARDRTFRLSIASSGREIFACPAHDANVYKVTYNPAADLAMTCGSDALVKLWKLPRLLE
jgi:WD40 repeat protein